MIDFTTLEANPIPPPIVELQQANTNLTTVNRAIKTAIYIGVGALTAYVIYRIYIKHKENESNKKNQFSRD
jgi:hypothetical protein